MDRRLIFRHPRGKVEPAGTPAESRIGVLDAPVPQGRQHSIWKSDGTSGHEKPPRDDTSARTATDTGVRDEYPKAFGRTLVKELGKMTPYLRDKGCSLARGSRRESALATVY